MQHPTRPVGLAGRHVRPPQCLEKKMCGPSDLQAEPHENGDMYFKFSELIHVQTQLCFCDTTFLFLGDVRSEYMSGHVRLDSSGSVGFASLVVYGGWLA